MARKYLVLGVSFLSATVGFYYFNGYPNFGPHQTGSVPTIVAYEEDTPACEPPLGNEEEEDWHGWRKIHPSFEWYVYSAYLDRRSEKPLVRVVALLKNTTNKHPIFCQMWTKSNTFSVVRAQPLELWIHTWDSAKPEQYYHPFLLSCPVQEDPVSVSVTSDPCGSSTPRIPFSRERPPPGEFVVCLKTLDFEKDVSNRLLEWLELQFLLGADSVFAYVHGVHPSTLRVLEHYANLGRLTWRNSTLPGKGTGGLWQRRRHEMAVYNDCLYRHLDSHRFVVNLDLDEAIVPVVKNSWPELLAEHRRSPTASLSARCVYFFDVLGEDPSVPRHMHMLRHVYRSSEFAPPGFAQKSFFSTMHAEVVSNHFALRAVRPGVRLLSGLGVHEARLHHYRKECPALMERECDQNYMKFRQRDTLLWKYKDKLVPNVVKRMKELATT